MERNPGFIEMILSESEPEFIGFCSSFGPLLNDVDTDDLTIEEHNYGLNTLILYDKFEHERRITVTSGDIDYVAYVLGMEIIRHYVETKRLIWYDYETSVAPRACMEWFDQLPILSKNANFFPSIQNHLNGEPLAIMVENIAEGGSLENMARNIFRYFSNIRNSEIYNLTPSGGWK